MASLFKGEAELDADALCLSLAGQALRWVENELGGEVKRICLLVFPVVSVPVLTGRRTPIHRNGVEHTLSRAGSHGRAIRALPLNSLNESLF